MDSPAPSRPLLRRLDDGIAWSERVLIVALLAIMVTAVFLDAIHRTFSAQEGRLAAIFGSVLGAVSNTQATSSLFIRNTLSPIVQFVAATLIIYAAQRTRTPTSSKRRAFFIAVGSSALLGFAANALVRVFPGGLVFSQQMALCLLLWVGLLGASAATRDHAHIAFELADKLWPQRMGRIVEWTARAVAAAFSLALAILAARFAGMHHEEWISSGKAAGYFESFPVPRFVIFGFLPIPLAVMGLRFIAYGVRKPA